MNPGKLNKRVAIYKPSVVADGMGGRKQTMVKDVDVWAEFKRPRFASTVVEGTPATSITQGVLIRPVSGIRRGWQVRCGGRIYDIIHVDESVKGEMVLTTQEVEK